MAMNTKFYLLIPRFNMSRVFLLQQQYLTFFQLEVKKLLFFNCRDNCHKFVNTNQNVKLSFQAVFSR